VILPGPRHQAADQIGPPRLHTPIHSPVPEKILRAVEQCIDRYRLITPDEPLVVAYSGGKDSLALLLALRELSFRPTAIAIDMGYSSGWAEQVLSSAEAVGLEAVKVVSAHGVRGSTASVGIELGRRLDALETLELDPDGLISPCTDCYSVKALILDSAAAEIGASKVAFGHHRTDALASLLKSALMYVDRWDRAHTSYTRENFGALVAELEAEAASDAVGVGELTQRLFDVARSGAADTDEPPRQPLVGDRSDVEIVRPMFHTDESDLVAFQRSEGLSVQPSGCSHGLSPHTRTPRELVHFDLLRQDLSRPYAGALSRLLEASINAEGEALHETRRNRAELLGEAYKPGFQGAKKL
jgi:tRNA(Ile)-lysidine synthase TilS/MesJ